MLIRKMQPDDMGALCAMVTDEWHHGPDRLMSGSDETYHHLERCDEALVATNERGDVVGAILLASPSAQDRSPEASQRKDEIKDMADQKFSYALEPQDLLELQADLVERSKKDTGQDRAGEVVLILVHKAARGSGVGRALLRRGTNWLKEHGAKTIHLATDANCDWQIYEHLGMKRVATGEAEGIDVYVYRSAMDALALRENSVKPA